MPDNGLKSWPAGVAGVVFAGGRSQRMGRDKALVEYRGRPLVAIAASILEQAGCPEILISGPSAYGLPFRHVPDEQIDRGPLGGLSSVLNAIASGTDSFDALVAIPVDCPGLEPETLAGLANQPATAICVTQARQHPTVGRWPVGLCGRLQNYLNSGGRTFAEFADLVDAARIEIHDANQFRNINTPEDLAD